MFLNKVGDVFHSILALLANFIERGVSVDHVITTVVQMFKNFEVFVLYRDKQLSVILPSAIETML